VPSQLHYAIGHGVFDIRCTTPSVPADDMTQHPQGWSRRDGKHFRQSTVDCFRSNRMHRWRCESDHCRSQEEVYAYCRLPVCDLRSFREQGCCITKSVWRERQRQQWQRRSRRDGTTVVNNINSGIHMSGSWGSSGGHVSCDARNDLVDAHVLRFFLPPIRRGRCRFLMRYSAATVQARTAILSACFCQQRL